MKIVVINYGLSNLLSVKRAFEHCGSEVVITGKPEEVHDADKIVLPGVGAFKDGMQGLKYLGLDEAIKAKAAEGTPILGICLGMQMLFDQSEENGFHEGLGLIPGSVMRIPEESVKRDKQCVPHIGWNILKPGEENEEFESDLLGGLNVEDEVYFVHSYEAKPEDSEHVLAYTNYGGRDICAVAGYNNVFGCQFHPEKSGKVGLEIINNFIRL